MNGFHIFGFIVAVAFVIAKARIDGQSQNYRKLVLNILVTGAVVTASGLLGATTVLQNLAIKGFIYVVLPTALWVAYKFKPLLFINRESFLYCVILALFSIAVAGEG